MCESAGRHHSFLCPNGTIFNQLLLTCDWWHNVDCGISESHYKKEDNIHHRHTNYNNKPSYNPNNYYSKGNALHQHPKQTQYMRHDHQRDHKYNPSAKSADYSHKKVSHEIYVPKHKSTQRSRNSFVYSRKFRSQNVQSDIPNYNQFKQQNEHNIQKQRKKISDHLSSNEYHYATTYRPFASPITNKYTPEITTYSPKYNIRLDGAPVSFPGYSASPTRSLHGFHGIRTGSSHVSTTPAPILTTISTSITHLTPNPLLSYTIPQLRSITPRTPPLPPPPRNHKTVFSLPNKLSAPKLVEFEPYYETSYPMFQILGKRELKPIYKRHLDQSRDTYMDSSEEVN